MTEEEVLIRWYKAHKIAQDNPHLLIHDGSEEASQLCGDRMVECEEADKELYKLDIPLVNLFKSAEFPQCSCTCAAFVGNQHAECRAAMQKWFGYRAALMAYVFNRYIFQTEHYAECRKTERETAEEITEDILLKMAYMQVVGDALQSIPMEIYEDLEECITHMIEARLNGD